MSPPYIGLHDNNGNIVIFLIFVFRKWANERTPLTPTWDDP